MDMHKNARLTPKSRAILVRRVLSGRSKAQVAEEFGVCVRTVAKWVRRYRQEAQAGLQDRSSRPRRLPRSTPEAVQGAVTALRRERLTMVMIAQRLGISRATVSRVLRRAGLNRLRTLEPAPVVRRYAWPAPGALIHFDIKKLGRIHRPGHRASGDRRDRTRGAGWEYVFVAIDDCSRLAFSRILPDETGPSAVVFLREALAHYRHLGVRVERIMTDNGSCFLSRAFAQGLRQSGLRHIRTRPYTPRTNGKAERFIQTALREWAYARAYTHSDERLAELPHFLHRYNWHRPHASLGQQPPISRLGLDGNNLLRLHS